MEIADELDAQMLDLSGNNSIEIDEKELEVLFADDAAEIEQELLKFQPKRKPPTKGIVILGNYISKKIKKNENLLCVFLGIPGSGKSYSAMAIAEFLDSNFTVDRVAFTASEFVSLLQLPPDQLPSGSVIIFDEASTQMNSRLFYSRLNIQINFILQTFRYRNLIVFFCLPDNSFLDSAARKLFNLYIQPLRKLKERKLLLAKPMLISTNPYTGKIYNHYLRYRDSDTSKKHIMRTLHVPLPSVQLRHAYEKKKHLFGQQILNDATAEIGVQDKKTKTISRFTHNHLELIRLYGVEGKSLNECGAALKRKPSGLSSVKHTIEKKLGRPLERGREDQTTIPELS